MAPAYLKHVVRVVHLEQHESEHFVHRQQVVYVGPRVLLNGAGHKGGMIGLIVSRPGASQYLIGSVCCCCCCYCCGHQLRLLTNEMGRIGLAI